MQMNTEHEAAYMQALENDLGVDPQTLLPAAAQIKTPFDTMVIDVDSEAFKVIEEINN